MKRTGIKRKSKTLIAKLKNILWELCKSIVRRRDGTICVICGKENLDGSGWHTGHFIPSLTCGAFLRYDLRNLHSSCYYCNVNLGGNGALFLIRLEEEYGRPFVDQIIRDKNISIKANILFYQKKIEEYTELDKLDQEELQEYTINL